MPRGTDSPEMKELPQWDKSSVVTLKGNGVPRTDGQTGARKGRKSSANQDNTGNTTIKRGEEMASSQELGAPQSARGMTYRGRGRSTHLSTQTNSDGADGARPDHGVLAHCGYSLLAPEGLAGDPAATESRVAGTTLRIPRGQKTQTECRRGQGNITGIKRTPCARPS